MHVGAACAVGPADAACIRPSCRTRQRTAAHQAPRSARRADARSARAAADQRGRAAPHRSLHRRQMARAPRSAGCQGVRRRHLPAARLPRPDWRHPNAQGNQSLSCRPHERRQACAAHRRAIGPRRRLRRALDHLLGRRAGQPERARPGGHSYPRRLPPVVVVEFQAQPSLRRDGGRADRSDDAGPQGGPNQRRARRRLQRRLCAQRRSYRHAANGGERRPGVPGHEHEVRQLSRPF